MGPFTFVFTFEIETEKCNFCYLLLGRYAIGISGCQDQKCWMKSSSKRFCHRHYNWKWTANGNGKIPIQTRSQRLLELKWNLHGTGNKKKQINLCMYVGTTSKRRRIFFSIFFFVSWQPFVLHRRNIAKYRPCLNKFNKISKRYFHIACLV